MIEVELQEEDLKIEEVQIIIYQNLKKCQPLLDNQQFYEYEQKVGTFAFRFINQNKQSAAVKLYFIASKQLLNYNQINSGFNLANKIVALEENSNQTLIDNFLSLYSVAPFCEAKVQFINNVLKKHQQFKEQICYHVGVDLINQNKYHLAWRYLIQTDDLPCQISLLQKWNQTLSEYECPYNTTRFVLIKLCQGKYENVIQIVQLLLPTKTTVPSLFLHLLIQAIRLQSKQAYDHIYQQFNAFLTKTQFLDVFILYQQLYQKVGVRYFGLKEETQSTGGIFGQIFQ